MFLLLGCGDGGARSHIVPWGGDDATNVVHADGSVTTYQKPEGDDCIDLDGVICAEPQQECADAAELVLGTDGKVIETVCYPTEATLSVEQVEQKSGDIAQNENNAVIALDGTDDGVDLNGDLSVDANNVVVYGEGPDVSVIDGDVAVDGNNIIVRGVTIQGDVEIVANDAVFLHCAIQGNLVITGNNAVVAACDVLGDVEVRGNNAKLAGNHIAGTLTNGGKNTQCVENLSAHDADGDGVLESAELGAALACR
jgi:hypothetical protein